MKGTVGERVGERGRGTRKALGPFRRRRQLMYPAITLSLQPQTRKRGGERGTHTPPMKNGLKSGRAISLPMNDPHGSFQNAGMIVRFLV